MGEEAGANHAFLFDAISTLSNRMTDLDLWPESLDDISITLISPVENGDGYAGWVVHAKPAPVGVLYKFSRGAYGYPSGPRTNIVE